MNQIEFEVGGKYKNMKGVYEVVSIDDDDETMHIRWENGEEVTTDVEFQKRVIERMEFEKRLRAEKKAKKARKAAGGRVKFEGLLETDFSRKVTGTTWRRRSCLGGAVKVFPDSRRFDIKSWSIARKPMIQWADVSHREPKIFNQQSKFFVRLDEERLYCGYCIETPKNVEEGKGDWMAFLDWLAEESNEARLREIAVEDDLVLYHFNKDGEVGWTARPEEETWMVLKRGEEISVDSLAKFIREFSEISRRVDLQIAKEMEKEVVVKKGVGIAEDITAVFEKLFPIYEATAPDGASSG